MDPSRNHLSIYKHIFVYLSGIFTVEATDTLHSTLLCHLVLYLRNCSMLVYRDIVPSFSWLHFRESVPRQSPLSNCENQPGVGMMGCLALPVVLDTPRYGSKVSCLECLPGTVRSTGHRFTLVTLSITPEGRILIQPPHTDADTESCKSTGELTMESTLGRCLVTRCELEQS